jgi:hypothetical protein
MTSISTIEQGRVKLDRHLLSRSFACCHQGCCFKLRRTYAYYLGILFLHTTMSMEGQIVGQGDLGGDSQGNPFENPDLVFLREKLPVQRKRVPEEGDKDVKLAAKKRGGRKKKMKEPKVEEDDEDKMSRWMDAEATTLIHLQGEMI